MGKIIGIAGFSIAYIIIIILTLIGIGIMIAVPIIYVKAIKKKKETYNFKRNYYEQNTKQMQEIIDLQKKQIEQMNKDKNNK